MTRQNTLLLVLGSLVMAGVSTGAFAQVTVPSIPLPAGVTSGNPIETGVSLGKLIAGYILVGICGMAFIFASYGATVDIIAWYNGKKTGGEVYGKALGMTVIAVFSALLAIFALTNIVNIGGAGTP
jgi:hypothetical protein